MKNHRQQMNTQFGRVGETWVANRLRSMGYHVNLIGYANPYHDLVVEGYLTVEVKSAYQTTYQAARGERPRFFFSFRRNGLDNNADLYVLVCFSAEGNQTEAGDVLAAFIIPNEDIGPKRRVISITSADPMKYKGKWATWRNAWSFIPHILFAQKINQGDQMKQRFTHLRK